MAQKKVKQKVKNGHQGEGDLFLLLHDNCWVSEDTLFPNHGVSRCIERWIPPSIWDGSLQREYFYKIDSATQRLAESVASFKEEIMLFDDINLLSWDVNDEEFVPTFISLDKEHQRVLPSENSNNLEMDKRMLSLENSNHAATWIVEGVSNGPLTKKMEGKAPLEPFRLELKSHTVIHSATKPFVCGACYKSFKCKQELKSHVVVHSDAKPFACSICDEKFKRKTDLKSHMVKHSDIKPFSCQVCDKRFKRKRELKSHVTVHWDVRPFACHICSQRFKRNGGLKCHMAHHSDIKPFPCKECHKKFKSKPELKSHMAVHSDAKPYSCQVCNRKFKRKHQLNTHKCVRYHEEFTFKEQFKHTHWLNLNTPSI